MFLTPLLKPSPFLEASSCPEMLPGAPDCPWQGSCHPPRTLTRTTCPGHAWRMVQIPPPSIMTSAIFSPCCIRELGSFDFGASFTFLLSYTDCALKVLNLKEVPPLPTQCDSPSPNALKMTATDPRAEPFSYGISVSATTTMCD